MYRYAYEALDIQQFPYGEFTEKEIANPNPGMEEEGKEPEIIKEPNEPLVENNQMIQIE